VRDPKVRLRRLSEIATNPPPGGLLCFWDPVSGNYRNGPVTTFRKRI